MKKNVLTLLGVLLTGISFAQSNYNDQLVKLGKSYKNFMFQNEPTKDIIKDLKTNVPDNLITANSFIIETITSKNKLTTQPFIARPDDTTLKQIYIIRQIDLNLREENQMDNTVLIDSLTKKDIPVNELVDNYYGILFTAIGNKNQPFNFSKADFKINEYGLKNDTEKGIFFLNCMDLCGTNIWGFMNVVKPANTNLALSYIKKYPKFNGLPYYQYADFQFPDFEMIIEKDKGMQSYKSYYLNKYYETLLYHLICLNKEGGTEKEINNLLLGSILKESNLYKYTEHKEVLESIFKVQKKD
ncbi:hypothetical protein NAT51_08520 [Flavobacterium amniphilum]|uniref:hypothetical protein n=1 Tax=Flavobacterium amniphilum TaxID=1834035 RepID=UPI002029E193|nr:hypothetical protein [Flavobacterium amniphilum]MCL9805564.1 hypothetical protein [Flavobacterium amniphilum]